ncbi:hypothetical protein R1sor_022234 [Riccia sorocarpa]|uniref:Uncharacterized protein n=1 Tax=Riccia sorocarpa TaxID=122646 RepID=A0ABD3GJA6_9MARC
MLFKRNGGGSSGRSGLGRSVSVRPVGDKECKMLAPVSEGPTPETFDEHGGTKRRDGPSWNQMWQKTSSHFFGNKRADIRMLLSVLGAPLAPIAVPTSSKEVTPPRASPKDPDYDASTAQYILQQFIAATGGSKLQNSIYNFFAAGKVKMVASEYETANKLVRPRSSAKSPEVGWFNLWQMQPNMWMVDVELEAEGHKVHVSAGCDGKLVWRHTPWLGAHAPKGPVRPLRRALQGLDPRTIANIFANARCVGEKKIDDEDCFTLKLATDEDTMKSRSAGPAEIIRHVLFGYFSQKTGLLVKIEDSHLTRVQNHGEDTIYWETSIESTLEDYREVDGLTIAHGGKSVVTLFRFGEVAMSQMKTRLEEQWSITEVAFNVQGISSETFLPPADIRSNPVSDSWDLTHGERGKGGSGRSRVAAVDKENPLEDDTVIWRVEV